jgi:hypothetical protein
LIGQRSTMNFDQALTGLRRVGQGLDMGRSGPGRPRHVSAPGCAMSRRWISKMGLSRWAWLTVVTQSGFTGVGTVHVGLRPLLPPPLFGSQAPGAPSSAAAPPSPSLLHGHAPTGDKGLIPVPQRLNDDVQGLYGFTRSPGTRRWGLGGGLESLAGLSQQGAWWCFVVLVMKAKQGVVGISSFIN